VALTKFDHGVLYAAAQIVRLHDEPQVAADVLKQAGLANVDCSKLDDYDKESLRVINTIPGVALTGLDD
jgi:hypothetical protein